MNSTATLDSEKPDRNDIVPVKFFGMEIPVPHWAVRILAVFVIVFVPVFLLFTVLHMRADVNTAEENRQKVEELTKDNESLSKTKNDLAETQRQVQDSQARLREVVDTYAENTKHATEKGEEFHKDAKLIVTRYPSDGCVSVLRLRAGNIVGQVQWNKDPARAGQEPEAPGAVDGGQQGHLIVAPQPNSRSGENPSSFKLSARETVAQLRTIGINITSGLRLQDDFSPAAAFMARGKCLNPHPGAFKSWTGRAQGCWLQLWRQWPDGCTHYQWFNSCSSSWDVDSRGKPRLYWTSCNH